MSSEVRQLLHRLGLSSYQQELVDNGFDSLGCLFDISEHDFETLNIDCEDRRRLQQEVRKYVARERSGDPMATLRNSDWHGAPIVDVSAADINNGEVARALRHSKANCASCSKFFHVQKHVRSYLIEGPRLIVLGCLTHDSCFYATMPFKEGPSLTPRLLLMPDTHVADIERSRDYGSRGTIGGYTMGSRQVSGIIVDDPSVASYHSAIFWIEKSRGGLAAVDGLSTDSTIVNGEIFGRNNLLQLHANNMTSFADEDRFLFWYMTHPVPKFEDHYTMMNIIGKGGFSTVHSCLQRDTRAVFAVKTVRKTEDKNALEELALRQEIGLLARVCHPGIILLQDAFEDSDNVFLVLEFASRGDLFSCIASGGKLAEDIVCKIAIQLLQALQYLHKRYIVHRDIKLQNILVIDDEYRVKLADFGLAKVIDKYSHVTELFGTPGYMPPEILEQTGRQVFTTSIDVWSLGVVLYICLCGFPPFSDELRTAQNPYGLFEQITRGRFGYPSPYWDHVEDIVLEFIDRMLTANVANRITVNEALLHPWIAVVEGNFPLNLLTSQISRSNLSIRRLSQVRTLLKGC